MSAAKMSAPALTEAEWEKVVEFGFDRPEERPTVRLMAAIEIIEFWPDTPIREAMQALLRHTLARIEAKVLGGGGEDAVWSVERDGIRLADAIIEASA